MSLAKLADLLTSSELHFCRVDELKRSDPWEGAAAAQMAVEVGFNPGDPQIEIPVPEDDLDPITLLFRSASESEAQLGVFVSCWHHSDSQSAAMWSRYSGLEEGVCVKSTAGRLRMATAGSPQPVTVSEITYIDRAITHWWTHTIHLCKHKSFEHEREVRAWIALDIADPDRAKIGQRIPVALDKLLEAVYISPVAHDWVPLVVRLLLDYRGLTHVPLHTQSIRDPEIK